MTLNEIFKSLEEYADSSGITIQEALNDIKQHPDFPKVKRGRPRKNMESPEPLVKRPRGRPPSGAKWCEEREIYIDNEDNPFTKKPVISNRPRGRPPSGTEWSNEFQNYIKVSNGELYIPTTNEKNTTRPRGRPPTGKIWDNKIMSYISVKNN